MLAMRATPVSRPSARVASKSLTEPLKVATAYGTSNVTLEWTVSACQVPVGTAAVCSVMLMGVSS